MRKVSYLGLKLWDSDRRKEREGEGYRMAKLPGERDYGISQAFTAHLKMWSVAALVHVSLSHYTVPQPAVSRQEGAEEGLCSGEGALSCWSLLWASLVEKWVRCPPRLPEYSEVRGALFEDFVRGRTGRPRLACAAGAIQARAQIFDIYQKKGTQGPARGPHIVYSLKRFLGGAARSCGIQGWCGSLARRFLGAGGGAVIGPSTVQKPPCG
ncbi:hypothetical protein GWK47_027286 [Chionoecetes opilio]|uniref:Uncharacterized protein n=1 Tax=Chionoecetes opilio TaxID=41210 RepID=A0A8J8WCN6_CHIOP|nr:hypothetical protein GWK47_027286 [Chionoecetes opilio]